MWVFSSGWIEDVIATPLVKSARAPYRRSVVCAPTSASELVRVSSPRRAEIPGRWPPARIRCSRFWVP